MKKIITLVALVAIILTGCGNKVDYQDVNVYYDMYVEQINKVDSTYIPAVKGLIEDFDLKEQTTTMEDNILNLLNTYLSKIEVNNLKEFYDEFTKEISSTKTLEQLGIDGTTSQIEELESSYEEISEEIQTAYKDFYKTVLDIYNEALEGANVILKDLSFEEFSTNYYGVADLLEEYIKSNGLEDQLDEVSDKLETTLTDLM